MSSFSIPKKTFLLIPAGTYRAVILNLEKVVGNFGEQVRFTFTVLTPDVEYTLPDGQVELLAWTSTNYSEKSKLYRWTRAALAGDFDPNADFQAALLINARVLVNVEKNASPSGGDFNKIVDIMAAPRSRAKPAAAQPEPASQPKAVQPPEPPDPPDEIPW
jgi:hypothetical protein